MADDTEEFEVAQATPKNIYDDAAKAASKPPASPAKPSGDIFKDVDTSSARPRQKMSPEDKTEAAAKRRESIGRHRGWGHDVWPGTPEQWTELIKSLSPTHLQYAMDLHEKLKSAGYPQGLATPPAQIKAPGALEAVQTFLKHSVPHWLGMAEQPGHAGPNPSPSLVPSTGKRKREPIPGDDFFKPPPGIGNKGGSLKDFEDVMPMLGGRRFAEADDDGPQAV